jgi:hypothetical protein
MDDVDAADAAQQARLEALECALAARGFLVRGLDSEARVTLWDRVSGKKLSGFISPKGKNLLRYLDAHPELDVMPPSGSGTGVAPLTQEI